LFNLHRDPDLAKIFAYKMDRRMKAAGEKIEKKELTEEQKLARS
jgi:hypothetical protein